MMATSTAERTAKRRQTLRDQGLKPVQFWVPDPTNAAYLARIAGEMATLAKADARDPWVQAWLEDGVSDGDGWSA